MDIQTYSLRRFRKMEEMVNLITQVGFPMVACIVIYMHSEKKAQEQREDNKAREDRMFTQLDKFGDAMDRFDTTLKNIDNRLKVLEDK